VGEISTRSGPPKPSRNKRRNPRNCIIDIGLQLPLKRSSQPLTHPTSVGLTGPRDTIWAKGQPSTTECVLVQRAYNILNATWIALTSFPIRVEPPNLRIFPGKLQVITLHWSLRHLHVGRRNCARTQVAPSFTRTVNEMTPLSGKGWRMETPFER
jgi:hypothetical protein